MWVTCQDCGKTERFDVRVFRCPCGGPWEPEERKDFDESLIDQDSYSVWRYQDLLGTDGTDSPVKLGAGWTPLVETSWMGEKIFFKMEYLSATGSFKDRGTEIEVSHLRAEGVKKVVEDSSGNAGASMAAYAARAGIQATIFAPESALPAKLAQIQVYGAKLEKIQGPRSEAARAVLKAAGEGAVYASHAYNPIYLLGQQTAAWEIWEQLDKTAPHAVVVPVGQGGLLLGIWWGFKRLLHAGLIQKMPKIFAVQPEIFSPVSHAVNKGLDEILAYIPAGRSIADGLAIVQPVRGKRILQALSESGGAALTVTEIEIEAAYHQLAENGFFVEPTSAAAAAALQKVFRQVGKNGAIVIPLTGSGLKSPVRL